MGVGVISPGVGWDKSFFFPVLEWDGTGEKILSHVVLFLPGGGRCSSSSPAQPSTDLTQITSLASRYWLLLSLMPLWIAANRRVESHHILRHYPRGRAVCRGAVPLSRTAKKLTCRCATRTNGGTIKWRSCNMTFFKILNSSADSSVLQAGVLHSDVDRPD